MASKVQRQNAEGWERGTRDGDSAPLVRFAANLAHEIRNPLLNIQLNASLLERELEGHEMGYSLAKRISAGIKKLDHLISALLSYAATPKPELKPVDLRDALHESLGFVTFWIEEGQIALDVTLGKRPLMVHADPQQLQQVFLNLILNAVQAINETGAAGSGDRRNISVRAFEKRRSIWVEISDTGCGIEARHLEDVFKPFFTTKRTGTGLGLAIVKSILRRHRAMIRCKSKKNEGTQFEIRFNKLDADCGAEGTYDAK